MEFTIPQLQAETNLSYNAIHRALQGYNCRGQTYTGLLDKCPAISFTDRTVVSEEEIGRSVRRRTHAYQFNFDVYRLWAAGGAVWLRPDDDQDGDDTDNISATFSTFSAGADTETNEDTGDENQNTPCIINKKFSKTTFSKPENTQHPVPAQDSASDRMCEMENAESVVDNQTVSPPILKPPVKSAGNTDSTNRKMLKVLKNWVARWRYRPGITNRSTMPNTGPIAQPVAGRVWTISRS